MRGRRFLLLIALMLGVTAVAASVAPQDRSRSPGADVAPPPPTGEATESRTETLSAAEAPQRLIVERGELIALEVSADERDAVTIPELGLMDAVDPAAPARFTLLADAPGTYPVELVEAGRRVGTIEIRP